MKIKNIKELKEYIKNLPDEMPTGLIDMSTDDFSEANYPVNVRIDDFIKEEGDTEIAGQALYFEFDNILNENPI